MVAKRSARPTGGAHGHAIAEPFAQHDQVRLDAIFRKREQRARAAEVGLHFVKNEDDIVVAAEALEQLQVFLLRMIRAAATEIRFGDQAGDPLAELLAPQPRSAI